MSKDGTHNDLDNFLKESFKEHTIKPAPELWDKIEQKFQPKVVPIQQYARLKVALYTSMAIIAGLVVILLITQKDVVNVPDGTDSPTIESTPELQSESETRQSTNVPNSEEIIDPNELTNSVNNTNDEDRNIVESGKEPKAFKAPSVSTNKSSQNQSEKNNPTVLYVQPEEPESNLAIVADSPEKIITDSTKSNSEIEKRSSTAINIQIEEPPLVVETFETTNTEAKKNNSEIETNSTKTNKKTTKRKHSSPRKYSSKRRSANGSYSQKGLILEDFTLKLNVTPAVAILAVPEEDHQDPNYESLRIDDPGFSFNGGIELAYSINEKWSVYSGVKTYQFKQTFEEHTYQLPSPIQDDQILKSDAGKYFIRDDNAENLPSSVLLDAYLKLRYLEIPLTGRYHINNFYIDSGILYSYLLSNKSNILLKNDYPGLSFERNGGFKKHTFGVSFGVGYDKTFNSGFRFEAGPDVRLILNNIYSYDNLNGMPLFIGVRMVMCLGRYYPE